MEDSPPKPGNAPHSISTASYAFKLDEGYCDDTKSQDDADSSMILTPPVEASMALSMPSLAALSQVVFSMDNEERSGTIADPAPPCAFSTDWNHHSRIHLQRHQNSPNPLYCLDCRASHSLSTQGSGSHASPRSDARDIHPSSTLDATRCIKRVQSLERTEYRLTTVAAKVLERRMDTKHAGGQAI